MATRKINELSLYYDEVGDGEPLILISGVSSDHASWKNTQVPAVVDAGFRVILFDNRDVGRTGESPVDTYSIVQLADDTAALVRLLGHGPVHIVGASMGGMIAQEMALHHPDTVRSLTIVCSSAKPDEYMRQVLTSWETFSQTMSREQFLQARTPWLFTHRFYENPGAHGAYRDRVLSNPYPQTQAGFARQCEATLEHDTLDRIHSIEFPTHVIVGAEDILIPPRHSSMVAAGIPGARLTVIPAAGHCVFWETPDEFNKAVVSWLANFT